MKRPPLVPYDPVKPGGPFRLRYLLCVEPCHERATTGCFQRGHLIGEPENVLPPLRLRPP